MRHEPAKSKENNTNYWYAWLFLTVLRNVARCHRCPFWSWLMVFHLSPLHPRTILVLEWLSLSPRVLAWADRLDWTTDLLPKVQPPDAKTVSCVLISGVSKPAPYRSCVSWQQIWLPASTTLHTLEGGSDFEKLHELHWSAVYHCHVT